MPKQERRDTYTQFMSFVRNTKYVHMQPTIDTTRTKKEEHTHAHGEYETIEREDKRSESRLKVGEGGAYRIEEWLDETPCKGHRRTAIDEDQFSNRLGIMVLVDIRERREEFA